MSKGLWGPRTPLTHQPWPVRDRGHPCPLRTGRHSKLMQCLQERFQGPTGARRGRRERTGQQELRVRPKRKKVLRGPVSMS